MLCLCVDRFGRYVTLYVFPILMVFIWLVIIGSTTSKIVADKQMALEEVCAHARVVRLQTPIYLQKCEYRAVLLMVLLSSMVCADAFVFKMTPGRR